jgi:YVTN family beta-propeller protein
LKIRWLAIVCLLALLPFVQPLAAAGASSLSLSSVDLGTVPRAVAVDSNSGTIYVVLYLNGTTLALDPHTLETVAKVATPSPYAVAVDSATDRIYVSQGEGGSISVIDGSSSSVIAAVQGAGTPYALAVDEAQNLVFAADTGANSLWIINGSTDAVSARIPMGDTSALAVDPTLHEAFIGNLSSDLQSGTIEVVDTSSLSIIRTVQIAIPPGHFAVDPASHLLFVTSAAAPGQGSNFLAINDSTFQTAYSLHLGEAPSVMTVGSSPDVYVSDPGVNRLYEIDGATGQLLLNSTGDSSGISFTGITSMAFDGLTGRVYITENDVTSLIVLSAGSASTTLDYSAYLLLAIPAVASGIAGLLAILYLRRRTRSAAARDAQATGAPTARSERKPSEGINGRTAGSGT